MVTKTKNTRQAIILIHGIGEQRPMDTALNFARSIAGENDIRQKPTPFGIQGETQRISIKESRYQPRTDIFEYYWAHRFRSNRLSTIKRWVIDVFLQCLFSGSTPGFSRKRLEFILASLGFFMMPLLYCLLAWLSYNNSGYHGLLIYAGATYALYRIVLSDILYGYIADAAKYLSNHPDNISAREEVRMAGLQLLTDIVNTGKYERVIIVGHSLGSVIGYDILSMAWARFVEGIEASEKDRSFIVRGFHELQVLAANDPESRFTQEFQKKQRLLRTRMAGSDVRWLVSDLVTLGSPLSFANFLIAKNQSDFRQKTDTYRLLLKCPPHGGFGDSAFTSTPTDGKKYTSYFPTYNALFLFTSWTNLFFRRDPIGGPMRRLFGNGIMDVVIDGGVFGLAHVKYFSPDSDAAKKLKRVLKLDTGRIRDSDADRLWPGSKRQTGDAAYAGRAGAMPDN
jgi:pimeloyl-ACP methyl ester carboxylesterase